MMHCMISPIDIYKVKNGVKRAVLIKGFCELIQQLEVQIVPHFGSCTNNSWQH